MKKNNSEFGPYLSYILKEMCKKVGADFNKINFKEEGWFSEYEWTIEEEAEFIKWMIDYLYRTTDARKELLKFNTKNKKLLERTVKGFILNYGWKYKKDN